MRLPRPLARVERDRGTMRWLAAAALVGGDVLDLRGMDANLLVAGNQDFVFSTSRAAGTVALSESGGNTVLSGHVNNDGVADFTLVIADGAMSTRLAPRAASSSAWSAVTVSATGVPISLAAPMSSAAARSREPS